MKKTGIVALALGTAALMLASGCGKKNTGTEKKEKTQVAATAQTTVAPAAEKKTAISALTGESIDAELAAQRPIAVMYPIDKAAQPQYGLDRVDVFYECMEEGNMSRQMGILQDWQGLERIGNIRSTRSYYIHWMCEWDAILVYYGGPIDFTRDLLTRSDVDNINGVDGVLGPSYGAYYRIPAGSRSEHTAYTSSKRIERAIEKAGFSREHREQYYNPNHFAFASEDTPDLLDLPGSVPATRIDMSGAFPVSRSALTYNEKTQLYEKTLYGKPQCDGESGKQMTFSNVLIQRCADYEVGAGYLGYDCSGTDDGFFLTRGRMIHVTWDKDNDYDATTFRDDSGQEIALNPGKTMIFIIQSGKNSFSIDDQLYSADQHSVLQ